MSHLFDPRTLVFAKHAQHIVLVHFPIALFMASVIFDLLASWLKKPVLRVTAYYNLIAAAVGALAAVATGITAWQLLYEGGRPTGVLLLHLVSASVTSLMIWSLAYWRVRRRERAEKPLPAAYIVLTCIAAAGIMVTGHLGGILSGVVPLVE